MGSSDGVYLVDGSGLSYEDRVTPQAFVVLSGQVPHHARRAEISPMLLPANGTGTLHRLNSGFPGVGVVRAKTGTLGRVSTVVGYLGRPEGTLLVALMYNGGRPWAARQAQWKLFRELGANGVVIPTDTVPDGRRCSSAARRSRHRLPGGRPARRRAIRRLDSRRP